MCVRDRFRIMNDQCTTIYVVCSVTFGKHNSVYICNVLCMLCVAYMQQVCVCARAV